MAEESLPIFKLSPPEDIASRWRRWTQSLQYYIDAKGITADKRKRAMLLHHAGFEVQKLFETLKPADDAFDAALTILNKHFVPQVNVPFERSQFRRLDVAPGETTDSFVSRLRIKAKSCNFASLEEDMIRDQVIEKMRDNDLRKRILEKKDIELAEMLEMCRISETASKQATTIDSTSQQINVTANTAHRQDSRRQAAGGKYCKPKNSNKPRTQQQHRGQRQRRAYNNTEPCWRCGRNNHHYNDCRFKQSQCHQCSEIGHLKKQCDAVHKYRKSRRYANCVESEEPDSTASKNYSMHALDFDSCANGNAKEPNVFCVKSGLQISTPHYVPLVCNGVTINFQLDSAACVTVISERFFGGKFASRLEPTSCSLTSFSGDSIRVIGQFNVDVECENIMHKQLPLVVVEGDKPALLGRNWLDVMRPNWRNIFKTTQKCDVENLKSVYAKVFGNEPGKIVGHTATIDVDPEATPVFRKAYNVPYPLRDRVKTQLEESVQKGMFKRVENSKWASGQVVVPKPNGGLRICGDYKPTVNPVMERRVYPLPTVDDMFAKLSGSKYYSKIDLSDAFHQLELSDHSKELLTVNTLIGLLQPQRMPYGISVAPQVYQRVIDQILAGIPNVVAYIDDILIYTKSKDEHLKVLQLVLDRLQSKNVRARLEKCAFLEQSVQYLGHKIDEAGVHPLESKVHDLQNAVVPTDIATLRSFLGLVNYYGRFISNLSTKLAPLNRLLQKDSKWHWSDECQSAFEKCKQEIASDKCLTYYSADKKLVLAYDASCYGVGAMISHVENGQERPIAFASRTLEKAERNYSQIEREALGIIFGVGRFHKYLYGRKFLLQTDAKPLKTILGPKSALPATAASRMQRWAWILSAYNYDITFRKTSMHSNADALSRLPVPDNDGKNESIDSELNLVTSYASEVGEEVNLIMSYANDLPITHKDVSKATSRDPILSKVAEFVLSGWPKNVSEEIKPYFSHRTELTIEAGCLLWGNRVVIPACYRQKLLDELHASHHGIVKLKALARGYLWWPNMNNELEFRVRSCETCRLNQRMPAEAPPQPWPYPSRVFERVHLDFMEFKGLNYLIAIDSYSKWVEAFPMNTTTAAKTIDVLRMWFAQFGLPEKIVTDNGPQYTSVEFSKFLKANGIEHRLVPSYKPACNGAAERAVQLVKSALKKAISEENGNNLSQKLGSFLLTYRVTPHSTTGRTPSELFLGRVVRTRLSLIKPNLAREVQVKQENQFETNKPTRTFEKGDSVQVRSHRGTEQRWVPGIVTKICGPRTCVVRCGSQYRYVHIDHIVHLGGSVGTKFSGAPDTVAEPAKMLR